MTTKIKWQIPLKTVSESNSNEHWLKKAKRHTQQQFFIKQLFKSLNKPIYLPCMITLTRIGPRVLDIEENLPMAFKWIKDEIGACIFPERVVEYVQKRKRNGKVYLSHRTNKGHADSDPRIKWTYAQEKGKILAIRIEIEPMQC